MSFKDRSIHLWGVKQNNLKDIEVKIPLGSFTVVCGPSGSGKSSLAFETLYAEGQRRYIESLNNYARQFLGKAPKPDIEGIENIPPAIAIEQKNSVKTSRSTVGTTTEIIDYLRLLFEKLGKAYCPTYGFVVERESVTDAAVKALRECEGARGYLLAPVFQGTRVATGAKLHALLIKEGFNRIYIPPISEGGKKVSGSSEGVDADAGVNDGATSSATGKKSAKTSSKASSKKASSVKKSKAIVTSDDVVVEGDQNALAAKSGDGASTSTGPQCREPNQKVEIGKIVDLDSSPAVGAKQIPARDFYIVVDRMAFNKEDAARITDSMAQAYHAALKFNLQLAGGRATVITTDGKRINFSEENSCAVCGFSFPAISSQLFSFNNPVGACGACNGFGNTLLLDEGKVIPNPDLSIAQGAIHPFTMPSAAADKKLLTAYCRQEAIDLHTPWKELPSKDRQKLWKGDKKFYGVVGLFEYLETKKYKMHVRVFLSRYKSPSPCLVCKGSRLKPESQFIKIGQYTISEMSAMTIGDLSNALLEMKLTKGQEEIAGEILMQIRSRLQFLIDVGVEYLSMDRPTRTLSGGEYQRLNLAKQLGMGLSQTLYVLDEPTVGLHPRDNDRLIGILKKLNELGNTLVVVEHDQDVIENSTHIIEMGPGSGHLGGEVIYSGMTADFYDCKNSNTTKYLSRGPALKPLVKKDLGAKSKSKADEKSVRPVAIGGYKFALSLTGCTGHNLQNVDVKIPLNRLVTVTGVSGSGKSTLISQTLYPALARALKIEHLQGQPYDELDGVDNIKNVLFIDQSPIGKTARSNPMTYLKIYDHIRTILSSTPESKLRGYQPGTFSLNVDGGRCPVCKGLGYEIIDMMFMDDVKLTCDACDGMKFRKEILEVTYKNLNIFEIMNLTISEAMSFFVAYPNIRKPLSFLKEVGLDYIRLGQSASTLSGGESQRLKIAREFVSTHQKATLYILDEPTTGLHFREIDLLMIVLNKLVESGGSVLLIEHNLEVIRQSDYLIDLGPDAGRNGGRIVAQGSPVEVMKSKESLTGKYLEQYCKTRPLV